MSSRSPLSWPCAVLAGSLLLLACADRPDGPVGPAPSASAHLAPPTGVTPVMTPTGAIALWPYTGKNFSGTPSDPVNLIITGEAKPVQIRAALLQLDGDRTALGFPGSFPFDCRWADAVGEPQTTFDGASGWIGTVIELECGDFSTLRFHVRLFDAGAYTIGAAHFEVLIPGTADHEVLSWELARQFVTADLARTGLLGLPPDVAAGLHPSPTYGVIRTAVYNGLPPKLRMIAGGPLSNVTEPVGVPTSGSASLLHLGGAAPIIPEHSRRAFTVAYNQVVPKPFCSAGPLDYVHVNGPLEIEQQVVVTAAGVYTSLVQARAQLAVTPMDVTVMPPVPSGATRSAEVSERFFYMGNGQVNRASTDRRHALLPVHESGGGTLQETLAAGPGRSSRYVRRERCSP